MYIGLTLLLTVGLRHRDHEDEFHITTFFRVRFARGSAVQIIGVSPFWLFKVASPESFLHGDHLRRIYLNCQRMLFRQTVLFSRSLMLKTGSNSFVMLYGGNIPFLVSLCFASQRIPTVCPHCAGSISTIGLRSFLLKVSGVSSHLSFCCTCLVSGFIISEKRPLVHSQNAQKIRQSFSISACKIVNIDIFSSILLHGK